MKILLAKSHQMLGGAQPRAAFSGDFQASFPNLVREQPEIGKRMIEYEVLRYSDGARNT